MFGRRRILEEISERLATGFGEVNGTLERMETGIDRELKQTRASIENNTQVTRHILVELTEQRPILERIDHGVQANTEGLMHVLDEFAAGATILAPRPRPRAIGRTSGL